MSPSITFSSSAQTQNNTHSIYSRPQKKPKMSITQTYFLAHSARGKLSKEASRPDHDLRMLVGHANMLDSLMLDLANAEQEQERWFNQTVSGVQHDEPEQSHAESIQEEDEEAEDAAGLDSDMEEDDETDAELTLTRTPSRHSPPALTIDLDSDSDDESSMPPSPAQPTIDALNEQQRQAIAATTTSFFDPKEPSLSPVESEVFESEGFYLPSRQQPTIIAAY